MNTLKTMNQDQTIRYNIKNIFVHNPEFAGSHIVVTSFNREVLLVGQTMSASTRAKATKLIHTVPDVKKIYNEIEIMPPTSLSMRNKDAWITTKIKAALVEIPEFPSSRVKVLTENGTVYLMGKITKEQADIAVYIAKQMSDVKKVVKIFN